jgi:putative phosphoribosyl transferase
MAAFSNRADAGRALAAALREYADRPDVIVLGLPRGGIPIAYEVARELDAPLDVLVVRKLGAPGQEELALGAIASGGVTVINEDVVPLFAGRNTVQEAIDREMPELHRREQRYRGGKSLPNVRERTVIVVDDGAATGATMHAAVGALRKLGAAEIVVALPVAAEEACTALESAADEVVCLNKPRPFVAVGQWYEKFDQTSDEEVISLLQAAESFCKRAHAD